MASVVKISNLPSQLFNTPVTAFGDEMLILMQGSLLWCIEGYRRSHKCIVGKKSPPIC